jgi:hypothetical protein
MMKKHLSSAFMLLTFVCCLALSAFGQETTGGLEITTRDPNGAVVPNVSVTISSSAAGTTSGFKRTATTGEDGFVRVVQVPPGTYNITAAATAGFVEKTVPNVQVVLGKATAVNVDLGITATGTVEVSSGDVLPIDTSDTKIQTNISAQLAELLPKGTNFASILKISPATRPEPRSGQFQIDGASGSENTFIIDGQEVTNVRTGTLDANSNLPFQLVQEVQIKTSGFEAEYGGATGGVVNVVTKGGSNSFRGEFGINVRPSSLNALGRATLRESEMTGLPEYFHSRRDSYYESNPSLTLGGPIIKNRWWFFGSYTPQWFRRTRTINYISPDDRVTTTFIPQTYKFREIDEYTFFRTDAQPFDKLRLTAAYTWNPISQQGSIPAWTSSLFRIPAASVACRAPICQAGNPSLFGASYLNQTGGRQNSQSITGQAVWTATSNFILSGRLGHYFLNEKLGTYGIGNVLIPRILCSNSSPQQFPAGFGCLRNQSNGIVAIENTLYDATTRNTFDVDGTFLFNGLGRHELKGGYQYNGIGNKVNLRDTDQIVLRYGQTIGSYSQTGIPSAPGAVGSGSLIVYNESGDVSSKNEGIFIQDRWQIAKRLTLNLGLRTEREDVPSFTPGAPGIKFDFQDKMAPRLGVAYDLTGDGKTVVKAFYGWFYDRFKYELPRGSFGGATYHQLFYEIFPGDTLASFTVASILGSGGPVPGGTCSGAIPPAYGKVRCDIDFRIASNTSLPLDEAGGIDPNIKAFRQSEFTVSFERDLGRNFVFSSRYSHKQVDHTVEDAGFPNSQGSEFYIIGNPGEGLYREIAEGFGLQALKPERKYDALEIKLDRRFANDFFFNVNYTLSRLWGNYSGLASSDEEGRLSPNVNRYFDQPHAGWTIAGGPDNGLLPTDRTHVLKFYGAYSLDWKKRLGMGAGQTTEFQLFSTIQSGTPLTSFVSLNNIDFIVATKRGDMGRTPTFSQFDFALRHRVRFGRDNRFTIVAETDILNVFNQAVVTNRYNDLNRFGYSSQDGWDLLTPAELAACDAAHNDQPCYLTAYQRFQENGSPQILADALDPANRDQLYNLPTAYQGPREVRFGLRFIF